jgi:outer membrane protein assembly factor BamB
MRGDLKNSGRAGALSGHGPGKGGPDPVRFHTGNGIFSTPVIDSQERIYVGSADHFFYCFDPRSGRELWRFDARELIDSAAVLSLEGRVYVPAGAAIYALDLDGNKLWDFDVTRRRPEGLYTFGTNYWWEGNVSLGPEGDLYAGNNDFFFYSITREGEFRWAFRTGFLIWSVPAFAADGSMFFAGFDMHLYALDRRTGKLKWKRNLKNPLVASPALGPDGTIYQGSFDGRLYALQAETGRLQWTFATNNQFTPRRPLIHPAVSMWHLPTASFTPWKGKPGLCCGPFTPATPSARLRCSDQTPRLGRNISFI